MTVVVTGSASGIGKAIADRLLSKGYEIVGVSKYEQYENKHEDKFRYYKADVRNINELYKISDELRKEGKTVEALINCAGVYHNSPIKYVFPEQVYNVLDTNVKGVFNACQAFIPLMDTNKHTPIITMSSMAATITNEASMYSASKAAVESLTKSIAKQVSKTKIRPNCIAPGPIGTNFIRFMPAQMAEAGVSRQIIEKMFTVDDIANVVELLMDERSSSIIGESISIGGV